MSLRRYHLYLAFPCAALAWIVVCAIALGAGDTVTRLAGTTGGFAGDGGPAIDAQLKEPMGAAVAADGTVYVADTNNHVVRRITRDGKIATIAGTGASGYDGDGGLATSARLNTPAGVALDGAGGLLIADTSNHAIRRLDLTTGIIDTVAGDGTAGFYGDDLPADGAKLNLPGDVAPLPGGGFLIADTQNDRIRKVASDGVITTVAGDGVAAFGGDGGLATDASLQEPSDVEPTSDGGYLIADRMNHRIRKVSLSGLITTEAGSGSDVLFGGSPAVLDEPASVSARSDGSFLIAEPRHHLILEVGTDRTMAIVAGTGSAGSSGDGGPAGSAKFNEPARAVLAGSTGYVVVDTKNHRIRLVGDLPTAPAPDPDPTPEPTPTPTPGSAPPPNGTGGTPGPAENPAFTPSVKPVAEAAAEEQPAPPVQGSTVTVAPAGGTVKVRRPGRSHDELLREGETLPVGTIVDTTRGIVRITSAADARGATQAADFSMGRFVIRQAKGSPVTELVLQGGQPGCRRPRASRSVAVAAAARGGKTRKLWGSGKGKFRTRGKYTAATVRGTKWLTEDHCDSTRVSVSEGLVAVRDLVRRKTVMVAAGESYTARKRAKR